MKRLLPVLSVAFLVVAGGVAPASSQRFGGFGGGFGGQERKLVDQYDTDKNGRLDAKEREAARAAIGTSNGGGMRGFGRGGMVPGSPGAQVAVSSVKPVPASTPLYDPKTLRTLFITFENKDWEPELEAFNDTDVDVPASIIVDGKTYPEVGIHFRGASSYRGVPTGSKRSLNLTFDFVNKDQKLLGYKTLNLLNANNDPSFVRTVLYSQIARDYIAAPKVNYIRVVINGEDWGVYLNAQQYNKDMAREFFDGGDGKRWHVQGSPGGRGGLAYLGEDVAPYKALYEIKTKDDPKDWAKLIAFTRLLDQTPPEKVESELASVLDIEGTLKFLALDVVLANSDGYWTRASDYDIYLDEKSRFHIIPHDMNEALNGNERLDPLVSINDPVKALRMKLLNVPALRARYLGYVKDIATKWLDWNRAGPLVAQYQALIAANIATDTRKLYSTESFQSEVADLKGWMESRRSFLLNESR
jgi:hypothetical protein